MKKFKSAEVLSSLRSRADEKVKPVVPPRPTVEALANAKRSPILGGYVEVDLSGYHATLQDAQGNGSPKLVKDTHTVTYAAVKFAQRSPLSSRDAPVTQVTQTGNAKTTQRAARAPFQNSPSRSPGKKSSAVDGHKLKRLSSTFPRTTRNVRQLVTSASSTQRNLRRDRKVTVINTCTKEAKSKPATSLVPRTTKSGSSGYRNSASTTSDHEYDYPAEDILLRLSRPPTLQVAPTGASLSQPRAPCSKRSEPSRRFKHEKPIPLPRSKQHTEPSIAISRQQRVADIAQYDYVHFKPRHVIVDNKSGEPLITA